MDDANEKNDVSPKKKFSDYFDLKINFTIDAPIKSGLFPNAMNKVTEESLNKLGRKIKRSKSLGEKIQNLVYEHIVGIPFPESEYSFRNDYHSFWEEMFKLSNCFNSEVKSLIRDTTTKGRVTQDRTITRALDIIYKVSKNKRGFPNKYIDQAKSIIDYREKNKRNIKLPRKYKDLEKTAPKNPQLLIIYGMSGSGKTTLTDYLSNEERYFRLLPKVTEREERHTDEAKIGKNDVVLTKGEFDKCLNGYSVNYWGFEEFVRKEEGNRFNIMYLREVNGKRYGYFAKDIWGIKSTAQHIIVETTNYELVKELKNDFFGMAKVAMIDCDLDNLTERLYERERKLDWENKKLRFFGKINNEEYSAKKLELEAQTANRIEQNKKKYNSFLETREIADIILNGTFEDNVKKVLYELSNEKLGC